MRAVLRRRRVAPVARHRGIGVAILNPAQLSVALGSRNKLIISISTPETGMDRSLYDLSVFG